MRFRPALLLGLTLAAFGALASCAIVRTFFPSAGPERRPFNHEAHTVRGVGCADCHETADKEAKAGMPSKEFCMNCHEDLDKDPLKPIEKKVGVYLDAAGTPRWSRFTRQSEEIKFSHKAHADRKVACTACHEGIAKDTGLLPAGMLQRMDSCTACHEKDAPAKNACATCHTRLDRTTPPGNHSQLWTERHGACSREGRGEATANDCSMCHQRDACTACHQTRPPKDHTAFWRLKGHCIAAGVDRGRCQTCHTSDSCNRCHQSTSPLSHTAGWNAPRNSHCKNCHVPSQPATGCAVCHKGTPGHAAAPPKPAWHNASSSCRSCHSASLRHPDNGDSCNACHR